MEDAAIGPAPYPFDGEAPEGFDSVVDKPRFERSPPSRCSDGTAALPGEGPGVGPVEGAVAESPLDDDKPHPNPSPEGEGLTGRVYINGKGTEGQYFDNVPEIAWGFPIGGYQPAQKWLKDRKGRALSWDDIRHYQKIIRILAETDRIMRGIALPLDQE